jgi:hypothetical protein
MMGLALGSLESQLEPHVQTHCVSDRSHLLPGGRRLFTLFKPLLRWLSGLLGFRKRASVIVSLRPYPTLALFIVPVILLRLLSLLRLT